MSKITVLGSGGWGLALSISLFSTGNELYVWSVFPDEIEQLKKNRETHLLKGVKIPEEINLVSSLDCVKDSDIVIFAVPSFAIRETAKFTRSTVEQGMIKLLTDEQECSRIYELIGVSEDITDAIYEELDEIYIRNLPF